MRHFVVATCAYCGDDAVVAAEGRVIDDPAALVIFVDFLNWRVEVRFGFETIAFPERSYLGDDLLLVGVAACPPDGGVEPVHDAVDLEAGGVVYSLLAHQLGPTQI